VRLDRRTVLLGSAGFALPVRGATPPTVPFIAVSVGRSQTEVLEARGGMTVDTLTQVASLSKPVFAAALLAELRARKLAPNTTLGALAPLPYRHRQRATVDEVRDPRAAALTVAQVLSHQAGLPNWSRTGPLSFVEAPGRGWRYSGEAYRLAQEVAERGWGLGLQTLASKHVFRPLNMPRSSFEEATGPVIDGHDVAGDVVHVARDNSHAAASLLSTAAEYARFVQWLLGSAPLAASMIAPQVLVDASRDVRWGLGLATSEDHFFHWGANPGYRALVVGSKKRGRAVLALSASDAGMDMAVASVRSVFGALKLLTFPPLFPKD
jgi:CubicO group peptidase (beta-lactamase class C family)